MKLYHLPSEEAQPQEGLWKALLIQADQPLPTGAVCYRLTLRNFDRLGFKLCRLASPLLTGKVQTAAIVRCTASLLPHEYMYLKNSSCGLHSCLCRQFVHMCMCRVYIYTCMQLLCLRGPSLY